MHFAEAQLLPWQRHLDVGGNANTILKGPTLVFDFMCAAGDEIGNCLMIVGPWEGPP